MEKKQCTKCKKDLEISLFNLRGGQLTKCCIKCLDNFKKPRQRTKCEHGRQRSKCKDCGRGHICEHNRRRSTCKDCDGDHICEHNKIKSQCKDCGGSQICEHSKIKSRCKDCGGGGICEHNRRRLLCKDCGGGHVCEHNKERSACSACSPLGHLAGVVRYRVYTALKNDKEMSSIEYLGCNIEKFKQHIEQQFTEGMSWENYFEWHIDHKIPLKYNKPSLEEVVQRLHYTNTQPMWASENMSKGH